MRPKAGRHGDPLPESSSRTRLVAFPLVLLGVLTSACTGTSTGGEAAATPDPAEASGPGGYAAPADLRGLCALLSYEALAPVLGPPKGTPEAQISGADPATSRTVSCVQNLGPRPDGGAYSGGLVTTMITFWRDVDKAKQQFVVSKESDVRNFARDNHVDDQPGVGAEAYRFVREGVTDTVLMLRTATRHSNLEVAVDFIASASAGGAEARSEEVLDAAAPYLTSLLSTVRTAAPALPGSAPSP
jgi:hypothetical protein